MTPFSKILIPAVLCSVALLGCQKKPADEPAEDTSAATAVTKPAESATATASAKTTYNCDAGKTIDAQYDNHNDDSKATLTIDGKQYTLNRAVSASGARYTTDQGLTAGEGLEWWGKDDESTLSSFPIDKPDATKKLFECKEKAT